MPRVTYFVGMITKEGNAEEVRETLLIDYRNVREKGNVAYALHRLTDKRPEIFPAKAGDFDGADLPVFMAAS